MKTIKFILLNLISLASMAAMEQSPSPLAHKSVFDLDLDILTDALQQNNQSSSINKIQLSNEDVLDILADALVEDESTQIENQPEQSLTSNQMPIAQNNSIYNIQDENLQCQLCQKKFAYHIALTMHEKEHSELQNKRAFCILCKKYLVNEDKLQQHQYRCHPELSAEYKYICKQEGCNNKRFAKKTGLSYHNRKKHPELLKLFSCDLCPKSYTNKYRLKYHKVETHSELPTLITSLQKKNMV